MIEDKIEEHLETAACCAESGPLPRQESGYPPATQPVAAGPNLLPAIALVRGRAA